MQLTPPQRMLLTTYRQFRSEPPRWSTFLRRSWLQLVIGIGAIVGVAAALYWISGPFYCGLILGIGAGGLASVHALFNTIMSVWPALAEVLDWEKIDALLAANSQTEKLGSVPPSASN